MVHPIQSPFLRGMKHIQSYHEVRLHQILRHQIPKACKPAYGGWYQKVRFMLCKNSSSIFTFVKDLPKAERPL